jgi:hypothetical protein
MRAHRGAIEARKPRMEAGGGSSERIRVGKVETVFLHTWDKKMVSTGRCVRKIAGGEAAQLTEGREAPLARDPGEGRDSFRHEEHGVRDVLRSRLVKYMAY